MKDSYLNREELIKFIATLPTRRLAAGAVIRNEHGELLPGGTVEAGEAPKPGCFREVEEELGLRLAPGRLLLVFHGLARGVWGDSTYYMYDAGVIAKNTPVTLQTEELITYEWVAPEQLQEYVNPGFAERLHDCLRALRTGEVIEMSSDERP